MPNNVLYGFHRIEDVFSQQLNSVDVNVVDTAITEAVNEHNRLTDQLLALFAEATTEYKTRYRFPGIAKLQPLDDEGRARKVRAGEFYDVALPLYAAGIAWGANYRTRVKMTVQDANDATATMIMADSVWVKDELLRAMFTYNQPFEFVDDEHGTLLVAGLASGDNVKYRFTGGSGSGTDNHFLAQAADIADATNPFPAMRAALKEHPENVGDVVYFVASNLVDDVTNLAAFVSAGDSNIIVPGAAEIVGSLNEASYPGNLLGYVQGGGWVFEWQSVPDDKILAMTTEGPRPLAMRQEPYSELQGFKKQAERQDHPYWEAHFARYAGFGGWNRTGAVVMQIGNASYTVPDIGMR